MRKAGWTRLPRPTPTAAGPEPVPDLSAADNEILRQVAPFTMTSPERLIALIKAVDYTVEHNLPGDFVECGVWRGGSMMAAALKLIQLKATDRRIHLFDTFEGMPPPTDHDVSIFQESAQSLLASDHRDEGVKCFADLADVTANLGRTGYPSDRLFFHRGKVEDTLPAAAPAQIALLRLDTDWFESTRHELVHLYPRLTDWGAMIIDDYGHWQGARRAVDEYLAELDHPSFLHRIDYTGRVLIKPGTPPQPPPHP